MKIILTADIKKLGRRDDIKQVADGYARNYLIPRGLARAAGAAAIAEAEERRKRVVIETEKKAREAMNLVKEYEGKKFVIRVAVGKKGELFGSIGKKEIGAALGVPSETVKIKEPIKAVGEYEVEIQFSPEASAKVIIETAAEEK